MSKYVYGLVTIKLGDVANDGTMGTALTAIGDTVKDSCIFNETEATKTEFFIEESDDPVDSFTSQKGIETISWSTYNCSAQNLQRLFGGTVTGAGTVGDPYKWQPSDNQPEIEQSIEITDRKGNKLQVVRAKLTPKKAISFQATRLGQIDIVATILAPEADVRKYTFTQAA